MSSSLLIRKTKEAISRSAEGLWATGFAAVGWFCRSSVSYWSSSGGQRVLVVAPHPDDEAAGCAGTLIRHKQCGDTVCVVYITDGRRSRAGGLGPDEMARQRRQEAESGVKVLGVDRFEWLGFPEGEWDREQLLSPLVAIIDQFAPQIIYAPSQVDFHPEHLKVAHSLAQVLPGVKHYLTSFLIRVYPIQVPLTPILTNLVADTSAVVAESATVFNAYVTQRNSIASTFRQRRYTARRYGMKTQAEEFWQMPAHQYSLLHSTPPETWPVNQFRGIRFHSWSDPLSYMSGMSERRRLAHFVRQTISEENGRWHSGIGTS